MKRLFKHWIYILPVIFLFTACKKFLDTQPDNRTELNTPDKVRSLLASAYPRAAYQKIGELMSDNAQDKGPVQALTLMDSTYYTFGDFISDDGKQDSPTMYWSACYSAIAAANAALDAIAHAPNPDDYNADKGEALVCRAYAHFMLVTLFAKPYNKSTATSDVGIPYVTTPEKHALVQYQRGTIQEDYDKIQKDLEEGLPLIDDDNYTVPKYHFTKVAANAFATRFYLYAGDYEKAVEHATDAFSSNGAFISNMRDWKKYLTYTVAEFQQNYTKATENANLLLIETPSLWARSYTSSRFGFTPSMYSSTFFVQSASGAATNRWLQSKFVYIRGGQSNYFIPKWKEYFYAPDNPNYGYPYVMTPVLTTEEVLFNRAEAYIYLGKYQEALNDLNLYISQRLDRYSTNDNITIAKAQDFYNTSDTQEALLQSLLYLKRIEFIQEGMRWFDDLRHNIKVEHKMIDANDKVTKTFTLDSTDNRRQWQLPPATTTGSVAIPANPR